MTVQMGIGCGIIGRAVASDSRRPGFEASHRQFYKIQLFTVNSIYRMDEKRKRDREWPFKHRLLLDFKYLLKRSCLSDNVKGKEHNMLRSVWLPQTDVLLLVCLALIY